MWPTCFPSRITVKLLVHCFNQQVIVGYLEGSQGTHVLPEWGGWCWYTVGYPLSLEEGQRSCAIAAWKHSVRGMPLKKKNKTWVSQLPPWAWQGFGMKFLCGPSWFKPSESITGGPHLFFIDKLTSERWRRLPTGTLCVSDQTHLRQQCHFTLRNIV